MWPDWVSSPGHLTYESGALLTALRGPAFSTEIPNFLKRIIFLKSFNSML